MVVVSDRKDDYLFIRWAQEIKRRDRFCCVICNRRGVELNAHHLNAWNAYPDERYDIDNGVCLCKYHHDDFHNRNGKGNNTAEQFEEYRLASEIFIGIAKKEALISAGVKKISEQLVKDEEIEKLLEQIEKDERSDNE